MVSEIKIFTDYPSAICSYGSSGMGKSVRTRGVSEYLYGLDYKIIDIYDEGRFENCFMALPNERKSMYQDLPDFEPQGYPVECLIPACPGTPRKLPSIFRPFRIAFEDLSEYEFKILLGRLNPVQDDLIHLAWSKKKLNSSFSDFVKILKELSISTKVKIDNNTVIDICDSRTGLGILHKVERINRLNILSDRDDPWRLDLKSIMKDNKTVTCFSFAFLSDYNVRHLLWGFLLRRLFVLRMAQRYTRYPLLCIVHREIQNNAYARGKRSSFAYEGQSVALEYIRRIMKEPRDVGIRILGDSQDPMSVDSDVRKAFATRFLFQMDKMVLDSLCNHFWLDPKTYRGIQYLGVGECAVKCMPQKDNPYNRFGIQFPCKFPPPRSRCKEVNDLFFSIWKKKGFEFKEWDFSLQLPIFSIERLSKKDNEVVTMKTESVYDFYANNIAYVLKDNPDGLSAANLYKDPLISGTFPHRALVYRVVEHMVSKNRITREKQGTSWIIRLI